MNDTDSTIRSIENIPFTEHRYYPERMTISSDAQGHVMQVVAYDDGTYTIRFLQITQPTTEDQTTCD